MQFLRDKSSIVLYAFSVILILYGVTGIGALGYIYFARIEDVYSPVNSVADQLLLASESLQNLKLMPLVSGEIETQIESIEYDMREMRGNIGSMAGHFYSMASSIDVSILGWRPFGSVAELMRSVARASSSAGGTIGQACESLSMIKELKVEDVLSEEYVSMIDAYSEQFASYGGILKQFISMIPPILVYVAVSYGMFILMGVSVVILTNKINKVVEKPT